MQKMFFVDKFSGEQISIHICMATSAGLIIALKRTFCINTLHWT